MTAKLSTYSTTPGSNNAASPNGWPEGQAAGSLNDGVREFAARVRESYEDSEWVDHGHTIVSSTSSSIKVSGDKTAVYLAGRALRVNQSASQDGWITASAYSAPDTSISVSGFTVSGPTQVEVGAVSSATSLPNTIINSSTVQVLPNGTTATTQAAGASSTTVATTAFVQSAVSGSRVRAYRGGSTQTVGTASETVMAFNTEEYDTGTEFDVTTNVGRFTATATGYYSVAARVVLAGGSWSGTEAAYLTLYKGGAEHSGGDLVWPPTATTGLVMSYAGTVYLTAGQYIDLRAYQASGGNVTLTDNSVASFICIDRLGS